MKKCIKHPILLSVLLLSCCLEVQSAKGRPTGPNTATQGAPSSTSDSNPSDAVPTFPGSSPNNPTTPKRPLDAPTGKCGIFTLSCGDGVCVPGENCNTCPEDCNGGTNEFGSFCCSGNNTLICPHDECHTGGKQCFTHLCEDGTSTSRAFLIKTSILGIFVGSLVAASMMYML